MREQGGEEGEDDGNETSVEMEYYCSPSETSLSSLLTLINEGFAGLENNSGSTVVTAATTSAAAASGSVDQEEQHRGVLCAKFLSSSSTTAATTSGSRKSFPAPLPPDRHCCTTGTSGRPRHPQHLIIGRTTSTPVSSSSTSSSSSAVTTSSKTGVPAAAGAAVVTVKRCASSHCLVRCHSANCFAPAAPLHHHHRRRQMIDFPDDDYVNDDYDEEEDDYDEEEGAGPASLLITPGMSGLVLVSSPPRPPLHRHQHQQQHSSTGSSCNGSSVKGSGGGGGNSSCSCKLTVNKNCNNRSDTCRNMWTKGSGAGAAVTAVVSQSSQVTAAGKKMRKSHMAVLPPLQQQSPPQAANQLITSSPSSSLTVTTTTTTAAASIPTGTIAVVTETGSENVSGSLPNPVALSLRRFASDESIPSDSGCGSSIGKASNSLSTGSNRSSICTVEDQPSASSSSSSSSSTASTSSSLSAGSTTGSQSSSSTSSCSAGSHSIRRSLRSPYVGQAVALQDCTPCPYDKDALAFRKGDIVNIIAKNDTGTWIGTCNGKIGHFKFISVEEMGSRSKSTANSNNENGRNSSGNSNNNNNCGSRNSGAGRPLTVASNNPSSHVAHADATDSSAPPSSRTSVQQHHQSGVTDSGTKSETMITGMRKAGGMRRRGEAAAAAGAGCGERREGERNSDSLKSSLSAAMTASIRADSNGNTSYQQWEKRKNETEGEDDNDDDHDDDQDDGGKNAGISGGERQFSRMREFLIMKKQQQFHLQSQVSSSPPSCAATALFDASNLLTFISVGQFLDLLSPGISGPVGNEILRFLEANAFPNLQTLTSQVSSGWRGRQDLHQLLLSAGSNVKTSDADLILQSLHYVNEWVRREKEDEEGEAGSATQDPKVGSKIIKRPGGKTCVTITSSPACPSPTSSSVSVATTVSSSCCTSGRREVRDQSEIESHSSSCPLVSSSSPTLSQPQQRQQQEQEHELHWQQKQGEQRRGSECSAGVVRTEEIPASRDQSPVTMNHVQQQQRQSATSVQKTTVNRLFLNLKEGFSLSSSSKNKNNNSTSSKNNNTNIREGGGGSGSGNRSSRLGSPAGALMIPKSAPSTPVTPTCVREPAPPATPSDELTNWFTRKLNFFSSSSHAKASTGSDGISSGNKSVGRDVSRDDLLDDCRRRSSRNDAAAAPPVRRRLSNSVSICSFHPTSSTSTGNASSSIPVPPATVSKYSKLRAKSKSFFRKEPRANSADTRCNLNKRHSSHEPLYANNNSGRGSNSSDPDYGMLDGETYSSGGHRVLYRSQSKFLDSDYLMEEITHTYKPNPVRRTSQGQSGSSQNSMSSKYSSRSVFDLRNSKSSHAGGENNMSYHAKAGEGTTAGVTTLEGKKRMVPLRKLLSCDSSAKMRSQSICVPRSLALEHCNRSGSSSNFRFPSSSSSDAAVVAAASAASTAAGGGSLHHLASIPTTPATTSASCKPISKMLLDSLNQRLREESIDLTVDPYSDVGGFCGIPAALVQRYADESAHDVYDVADALDHLRLESLLMQGRRGIPNDFLGDWCSGVTLAETMCQQDLHKWLISIGLSMYEPVLLRNGWSHMDLIGNMKEADMEMMGIRRKSHQRIFINAIEAMKMNHRTD